MRGSLKKLNLTHLCRELNLPVMTVRYWILTGQIKLPEDVELLKKARKVGGRWTVLDESQTGSAK